VRRPSRRAGYAPAVLLLLGLTFLLVGFARPQRVVAGAQGGAPTIVLAFDTSGSMAADDVQPTRLRAARSVAIEFLKDLPAKYRVAVVTFGNNPHLAVAPTFDRRQVLTRLPTAVTPLAGTATGDAISFSVAVIVSATGQSQAGGLYRPGAVLVLSDGTQTAGGTTPKEAAVSALVDFVPVSTIAFGTPTGIVVQPTTVNGRPTSTQIPVPAEPTTLRTISQQTHGSFFTAASVAQSPAQLAKVYANLRSHTTPGHRKHELSAAAGGVALVLILAGIGLSGLWFGRVV
jgi:Ca-activated chloride channel homolog